MAYFDAFTATLFRTQPDGQRVIAPFGSWGRVYLVPTDVDAARLTRAVRRLYQLMLATIIGVQVLVGWRGNLIATPLWLVVYFTTLHLVTRRLPRSDLTVGDLSSVSRTVMQAQVGRAIGTGWLVTLLVTSALFVAATTWLWLQSNDFTLLLAGGFFALCGLTFVYQLIVTRRASRT